MPKKLNTVTYRWFYKFWKKLQDNEVTLPFTFWLHERGISRRIHHWLAIKSETEAYKNGPSVGIKESRAFFEKNRERCKDLLAILADDTSRAVWGGVVSYRATGKPMDPELYSLHDQYFARDILQVQASEVFVDCGAFEGDTIRQFIKAAKKSGAKYKGIVAFEPSESNYKLLQKSCAKIRNLKLINKGVSDKEDVLLFLDADQGTRIAKNGEEATAQQPVIRLPVINIDAVPECHDTTWIKMDIEGAEMAALRGARETILRNKPKLTICIYHSNEDMLQIAEWIHTLVPEYRLYIRHHGAATRLETVLYAVV